MDPMWKMHMKTLTNRMMGIKTGKIVREAISKWYFENGIEEPLWYVDPDPQWWKDYLKELEQENE